MKELVSKGIGVKNSSADSVTVEVEATWWDKGVFNISTAKGLSNAVFFYNGKTLGFRGFQEHVDCQADQFEIGYDYVNSAKYIMFHPRVRKNAQGGLKQRRIYLEPIKHYEEEANEHSVYKIFHKYLNLIPRNGSFYRKPLAGTDQNSNVRFSAGTIAQHTLKQMMKNMFNKAELDIQGRRISNHAGRVTLCTSLLNENYTDKAVSSRRHHKSNAIQSYQRETYATLKDISNILDSKPQKASVKTEENKCPRSPKASSKTVKASTCSTVSETPLLPTTLEECLTTQVPTCVKTIIIMKEGRRIVMDI